MAARKTSPQPRVHLAEARTLRGWSQQKVADHIGTTYVNVSRWERGITRPNPYFRRKLCTLYSKSEAELNLEPVTTKVATTPVPIPEPPPPYLYQSCHRLYP